MRGSAWLMAGGTGSKDCDGSVALVRPKMQTAMGWEVAILPVDCPEIPLKPSYRIWEFSPKTAPERT